MSALDLTTGVKLVVGEICGVAQGCGHTPWRRILVNVHSVLSMPSCVYLNENLRG